jgi:chromosome segregation ATPase
MKGLWILAGLAAGAVLLWFALSRPSSVDVDRKYEEATKERPTVESLLADCATLVRQVSDQKPAERKKTELQQLRDKFEALSKEADDAKRDTTTPRDERKKRLERLGDEFWALRRNAEDLRVRLTKVKDFDERLQPKIAQLGRLTKALADAQTQSTDAEFQQRALSLMDDGRKYRQMAEAGRRTMAKSYVDGRVPAEAGLNGLDDVLKSMEQLLAKQPEPPKSGG